MISEVEIYLQKRDTDYGRVECWYLWFFIIFRGDLVLHGGLCCTSIFKTTHLTTLYTDMPYTMHHYALNCTPICPTLYADMPYTIRRYALNYTPICPTLCTIMHYTVHLLGSFALDHHLQTSGYDYTEYSTTNMFFLYYISYYIVHRISLNFRQFWIHVLKSSFNAQFLNYFNYFSKFSIY